MHLGNDYDFNDRVLTAMFNDWCLLNSYTVEEMAQIGAISVMEVLEAIVKLQLPAHYSYPYRTMLDVLDTARIEAQT